MNEYDFDLREEKRNKYKKNKNILIAFLKKCLIFILLKIKYFSKDINNLKINRITVKTEKKIKKDITILFISDLHLDIINNTNKLFNLLLDLESIDYILLAGDYFDKEVNEMENEKEWKLFIDLLKTKSKNIIGVMGNHDGKITTNIISKDIELLINKKRSFKDISFYGVEDFVTFKEYKDFKKINESKFNLLISHTPDIVDSLNNNYDLILSGHTHGGQIKFCGISPLSFSFKRNRKIKGFWFENGLNGFTTTGFGCSGVKLRSNIRPEIVLLKIKKQDL